MRKTKRVIAMLLTAVFVMLSFICVPFEVNEVAKAKDYEDVPIVLSLGDSYSSGEGCEPFYYQDLPWEEKVKKDDWLAHRSMNSWPGMLKFNGKQLKDYKYENDGNFEGKRWFFQAVSGAETKHIYSNKTDLEEREKDKQRIKYVPSEKWRDMIPSFNALVVKLVVAVKVVLTEIKEKKMPFQLDIVDEIKKETGEDIDYVTITIGGNDMGFADIITAGVISSPVTNTRWLLSFQLHEAWKKFGDGEILRDTYKAISEETGKDTTIIVVGYPELLDKDGRDMFFSQSESDEINKNVREFNEKIEGIVKELQKDMNIHFVSVKDEFEKHKAYSSEPYINPIMLTRSEDVNYARIPPVSAYSIHPNYIEGGKDGEPNCGVEAYAKAVQKEIDRLEKEKKGAEKNSVNKKAKKAYAQYLSNIYNAAYDVNDDYVDVRWAGSDKSYNPKEDLYYDKDGKSDIKYSPGYGDNNLAVRVEYYGIMDIDSDGIDELMLGKRSLYVDANKTYIFKYNNEKNTVEYYDRCWHMSKCIDESTHKFYKNGSFIYDLEIQNGNCYGTYFIKKSLLDKYMELEIDGASYKSYVKHAGHRNGMVEVKIYYSDISEKSDIYFLTEGTSAEPLGTITSDKLKKLNKALEKAGEIKKIKFYPFSYENLKDVKYINIKEKGSDSWIAQMSDYVGEWSSNLRHGNITIELEKNDECNIQIRLPGTHGTKSRFVLSGKIRDDGSIYYEGTKTDYEEGITSDVTGTINVRYIYGVSTLYWNEPGDLWYREDLWYRNGDIFKIYEIYKYAYSKDDAYRGVRDYLESQNYDFDHMNKYNGYLIIDEDYADGYSYRIILSSYTGALIYYYVDKYYGDVYVSECSSEGLEETYSRAVFNIKDYLN